MEYYKGIISPILDHLDSETMHVAAREALHLAETMPGGLGVLEKFAYGRERFTDPRLKTSVGGIELDNPVMVGAGWDKKARAVRALYQLGFSGVEVGSVLRDPQPGNPKPRQFVASHGRVALNSLGFNSPGVVKVALNLADYRDSGVPIGISLGKNKDVLPKDAPSAHAAVVSCLLATEDLYDTKNLISYFAINVSSPNTPGLRELQDKKPLTDIVQAVDETLVMSNQDKPVFIKISPDLTYQAIDDVIEVAIDNHLAGIIAANTTIDESLKAIYGWANMPGGLSGNNWQYQARINKIIAHIYRQAGDRLDIIGVGGVDGLTETIDRMGAGARAVQVVAGIREIGTTLPGRINRGLVRFMDNDGSTLSELVGSRAKQYA